ncbi:hypothetical protein ACLM5H_07340 [Fredinandcohnia humi]
MYYVFGLVALFSIGVGALGCGIFMYFVRMEKNKALMLCIVGILLVVAAMASNVLRPSYEKDVTITVEETAVTNEKNKDGKYICKVNDPYTLYHYYSEDKSEVEEFCAQFMTGEKYDITYRFKSGIYTIVDVK